jgi:hypothetical protein
MGKIPESVSRSYADSLAGCLPTEAAAICREWEYVAKLYEQDWTYEFSDDHRVYEEGRIQMHTLQALQREIDPAHVLWNMHCPQVHCRASITRQEAA